MKSSVQTTSDYDYEHEHEHEHEQEQQREQEWGNGGLNPSRAAADNTGGLKDTLGRDASHVAHDHVAALVGWNPGPA